MTAPIREAIERIVHARNGKVNEKPTIDALEALLSKHTERAVLEGKIDELDRLYYKTPPENGMSDIIEDRIKTLKTQLEAKE